ncbi:hypothetical protein [Enterocloster bolteae]|jgi:hypothetical protein|uniref:hypothetical protein n=2 Tax=Enterocloster bolteae TaxID=208479 RepID=UPI0014089A8B|nr:hypothetical protein [Enterocloster bolteae]
MPLMNFIKIRAKKLYTRISDVFADNRGAGRINHRKIILGRMFLFETTSGDKVCCDMMKDLPLPINKKIVVFIL